MTRSRAEPNRELRCVAIGAGYFAPFHLEAWSRIPGVKVTAVADREVERAESAVAGVGTGRAYADWRQMIDEERPDFVDVITPPDSHEDICSYAAARGIHIVCQKPLAPTMAACLRIVEAAERAGVRFMVHENWRWQPWYRAIKRVQADGAIGDFTHLLFVMRLGDGWAADAYVQRQPYFRDYPRLLFYETGVHFVDTFRYLCGEVASVFASCRRLNPRIAGEDAGELHLTFENGVTAVWDANRYNEGAAESPRYTFGELRVDATAGHLHLDTNANISITPLGKPCGRLEYERAQKNFGGDCVYFLQRHFVDRLRSGDEFESTGRDYLRTVRVVEAAYESAATGQVVRLT